MRDALVLYLGDGLLEDDIPTYTYYWLPMAMLTMAIPVSRQQPPLETPSCRAPSGRAWIMGLRELGLARITVWASAFV